MTLTQSILDCKTPKEVVELVDAQAKATLRGWKKKLLEEALEGLVAKHHGPKWLKIRERKPTPWVCLKCGPRESNQVKRNGHYQRSLVVTEGIIHLRVP